MRSICLFFCLSVCLSAYLFVSVNLFRLMAVSAQKSNECLPHQKNSAAATRNEGGTPKNWRRKPTKDVNGEKKQLNSFTIQSHLSLFCLLLSRPVILVEIFVSRCVKLGRELLLLFFLFIFVCLYRHIPRPCPPFPAFYLHTYSSSVINLKFVQLSFLFGK